MKKLLAMSLALVMSLSLVACSSSSDSSTTTTTESASTSTTTTETATTETAAAEDIEIAVVLKTLSSEYWNYVKAGCDAAAAELGIDITVVGPGAESEIAEQVAMIEQQIGLGVDAIVVAPNDASSAMAALQPAIDAGIPVLAVDTNVGIEGQTCFVGTSNVDAAAQGGEWAASVLGSDVNAVIIYGQEGDNTSNMRREGYQTASAAAGITVLAEQSGQNTTDGATKTMEDLLTAYPGEIDVVFCHNDDTAIGAMNACKSAGYDDVTIVGFDGNVSAVELILSGDLAATVAQQPYVMGYEVVMAAYSAAMGETVEESIAAPAMVVTAENGEAYIADLADMLA